MPRQADARSQTARIALAVTATDRETNMVGLLDGRGHDIRPSLTTTAIRVLARRQQGVDPEMLGLADLVGPGGVCIDVGAAAGLYTLALSRLVGAAGQVHSIEPLRFAHPLLTRLLRARDGRNVRHHSIALGREPGQGVMSVPIGRYGPITGRSFLAWRTNGLGSNIEFDEHIDVVVKVDTLDELCARAELSRLDFVKIDVEGAEFPVLQGGAHTIETFRPAILMEIEPRHIARYEHSADDVVGWLVERGYTMHVWQQGWRSVDTVCAHARNYLFR